MILRGGQQLFQLALKQKHYFVLNVLRPDIHNAVSIFRGSTQKHKYT